MTRHVCAAAYLPDALGLCCFLPPNRRARPALRAWRCMRLSTARAWKAAHEWSERFPRSASGQDHRLEERKARLGDLLTPVAGGIVLSKHIEADGATVFRHACKLGCEGIVSKQRASSYRSADQGVA
jgi:hypothetical protein